MTSAAGQIRAPSAARWSHRLLAFALGAAAALLLLELTVRMFSLAREVGPSFTEWHPEDGVQLKRNWSGERWTPEFRMRLSTNALRFRGPELPDDAGHTIVCLGDSFTMGYGVDDGEEYPALLRSRMPPGWTVINAGIGGQGNGRWLRLLQRDGAQLRPAVVVLQFCGNDYLDNLREHLYTLAADGSLCAHPPAPQSLLRCAQSWIDNVPGLRFSHLLGLGRQAFALFSPPPLAASADGPADPAPGRKLLHALAIRTIAAVRQLGAMPLAIGCVLEADDRRELDALLRGLDVTLLSMPGKADRPELYYRVDGHWNAAGHALVADLICAELRRDRYGLRQ